MILGGSSNGTSNGITFSNESLCVSGQCGSFNGISSYIDCGNADNLKERTNLTISSWFKVAGATGTPRILSNRLSSDGYEIVIDNAAGTVVWISNNVNLLSQDIDADDKKWHNIVFTFDVGLLKLYKDGNYMIQANNIIINEITNKTYIGQSYGTVNRFFEGLIDDIKIYNAALSSSQIKQNYIAGLNSLIGKGLILEAEFKEKVADLSSNK